MAEPIPGVNADYSGYFTERNSGGVGQDADILPAMPGVNQDLRRILATPYEAFPTAESLLAGAVLERKVMPWHIHVITEATPDGIIAYKSPEHPMMQYMPPLYCGPDAKHRRDCPGRSELKHWGT